MFSGDFDIYERGNFGEYSTLYKPFYEATATAEVTVYDIFMLFAMYAGLIAIVVCGIGLIVVRKLPQLQAEVKERAIRVLLLIMALFAVPGFVSFILTITKN